MASLLQEWRGSEPSMRLAVACLLIASGLSLFLTLFNYPVIGHDAYVHLNWLDQFIRIREQGVWYPRWLPDSFGGFGSPAFYFYPPLPYWIASFVHSIVRFSPDQLYNIVSLIATLLSVFTGWLLLREYSVSKLTVLTGVLVYSFLAYRFVDVFVRDALGEHGALVFLPLVFLGGMGRVRRIALLAIGWTGLFLTSLPIAYLAVLSVAVWIIARRGWREVLPQFTAMLVAALCAAIYIVPAVTLRIHIHARHLWDLPMNTSLFGFAMLDLIQGKLDLLRIVSVGTLLAGVAVIVTQLRDARTEQRAWTWVTLVAVVFQIPLLSPLWRILWGMPFVQFSWRWNGVLLLALAVIFVKRSNNLSHCVLIFLSLLTIASELTLSRNIVHRPALPIDGYRMDAPEYAPIWAANDPGEVIAITQRRMYDPQAVLLGLSSFGDSIHLVSRTPEIWIFEVALEHPSQVRFHQFYWPYWTVHVHDSTLMTKPDPNGLAFVNLPSGRYSLTLQLDRSKEENIGGYLSIAGASILVLLLASQVRLRKARSSILH